MKNHLYTLLLLLPLLSTAQGDTSKKGLGLVPKADVLLPIISAIRGNNTTYLGFSLEKEIGRHSSLQLTYQHYADNIRGSYQQKFWNFYQSQILPEYRYYLNGHTGFYIGAHGDLLYSENVTNDDIVNANKSIIYTYATNFAMGINAGYRYMYKRIVVDLLLGDSWLVGPPNSYVRYDWINLPGNQMGRVSVNIGYRF